MQGSKFISYGKRISISLSSFLGLIILPLLRLFTIVKPLFYLLYSNSIKYRFARPIPKKVWIMPSVVLINPKNILLGENVRISRSSTLSTWTPNTIPQLYIGSNSCIGECAHITAINKVFIGDNVLIGKYVTITDNSHGISDLHNCEVPPLSRKLFSKGQTVINDNVWIGDKVTILPGVSIGRGSIIGANSVVTSNIPDYCVACGNPAKIVKQMK